MRSAKFLIWLTGLFTLLCSAGIASAQQFDFNARHFASSPRTILEIKKHGFPDTVQVADALWSGFNPATTQVKSVHDMVKFYVVHDMNHLDTNVAPGNYQYKMIVNVYGLNGSSVALQKDTLTINYDRGSVGLTYHVPYQDLYISKYSSFHKILVEIVDILSIDLNNVQPPVSIANLTTLPGYNCAVETEIWQQSYDLQPYGGAYQLSKLSASYLSSEKALEVNFWNTSPVPTPAMYEMEWTYVDDYDYNFATHNDTIKSTSQLHYDFKNNATRIITDQPSYKIPIIYEHGYLVFRVRIIRPDIINYTTPVYSDWSITTNSGTIASLSSNASKWYYTISQSHLGDTINWKYTVSFAEEGKYKQVLNYFDGSLKNRQTITRFNSDPSNLIATENIYDFKGRPAISILPTPVNNTGFQYVEGLSLNSVTGAPYKAADFDTLQPPNTCPSEFSLSPLATTALANKYYSHQNTDTADFQKYVPDAGGYPLVHTILSPEDDKKILKQGGAGDSLQMGSGHITQYNYVTPEQSEINRLFGTEAGRAEYYQKTVVTDPNGQSAYEITDYEGKKVATGMIGLGPDSSVHPVDPMVVPDASTINENLLDGIQQIPSNNTWALTKPFYVEASGDHTMQYILTVPPFPVCQGSAYLTVAASYHYEMFDDCGNLDVEKSETLGKTGYSVTNPGSGLNTGAIVTKWLDKGKHVLDKTMTVSFDSVSAAVDSFIVHAGTCLKDENYFIRKAVESKEFPCPIDTLDPCALKKQQMMADLFPGAKYGGYVIDTLTGAMDSVATASMSPFGYSIFDVFSPCNVAMNFQLPMGGALSMIASLPMPVVPVGCKTFRFRACDSLQWPDTVMYMGRAYTNIRYLPVDTFIMIFDTSMARALLPLHPEYCKNCDAEEENYPEFLSKLPDYGTAEQLGYFTLQDIIAKDPLYQGNSNYYDSLALLRMVDRGLDTICIDLAYCGGVDTTTTRICMNQIFNSGMTSNYYNVNLASPVVKEAYWRRLIAMYIANRNMRVQYLQSHDTNNHCAPCDSARMSLKQPSVYGPYIMSPLAGVTDSMMFSQLFANMANGFSMPAWVNGALSGNYTQATQDSANMLYNQGQYALCDSAVALMARSLSNCSTDTNKINAIRDSLHNYYCTGPGVGTPYDPAVVRRIILSIPGISLSDLCNPYLINYSPYPAPQFDFGSVTCKAQKAYLDAAAFFNATAVHNSINNRTSYSGYALNHSSSYFETAIYNALGGPSSVSVNTSYDALLRQYHLEVANSSGSKVNFWLKKMDPSGNCLTRLDSLPFWYVDRKSV
ncbi:MAG TPA: hypothetical protein VL093_01400, partial [Flavipsychrobacter sp.]|nr:hypothetical protein [Flavipsychrobacter sp.]